MSPFAMPDRKTGLIDEIDRRLHLLKIHKPYHESDHLADHSSPEGHRNPPRTIVHSTISSPSENC